MARPFKVISIPADQLPQQSYFTVPEIVALTGLDKHTIQYHLRLGRLKGKKIGKEWRIYRDSLINDEGNL